MSLGTALKREEERVMQHTFSFLKNATDFLIPFLFITAEKGGVARAKGVR